MPPRDDAASATPAVWAALLDAIEHSLTAREQARRDGTPPPAPLHLPDAPGPIPASLQPRARRVLDALAVQETELAGDLVAVRTELARVSRADAGPTRTVATGHRGGFEARA